MRPDSKTFLIVGIVTLVVVLATIISYNSLLGSTRQVFPAPDSQTVDLDGDPFSLSDFRGEVVILHITNIEVPLCIECEETIKAQAEELQKLKDDHNREGGLRRQVFRMFEVKF